MCDKPRYEFRAWADRECEQQVDASWHDNLVTAKRAVENSFIAGMTMFAAVYDHKRGFWCIRSSR